MPNYYQPLRSESDGGLFDFPFLVGFSRTADGKVVLLKAFSNDADHNPLIFQVESETETSDGTVLDLKLASDEPLMRFVLKPLTAEYVLAHRDLYPFVSEQLLSLLQPGTLSLFAQAALPAWYEETFVPPADEG